jgi:hypothetical protein
VALQSAVHSETIRQELAQAKMLNAFVVAAHDKGGMISIVYTLNLPQE